MRSSPLARCANQLESAAQTPKQARFVLSMLVSEHPTPLRDLSVSDSILGFHPMAAHHHVHQHMSQPCHPSSVAYNF